MENHLPLSLGLPNIQAVSQDPLGTKFSIHFPLVAALSRPPECVGKLHFPPPHPTPRVLLQEMQPDCSWGQSGPLQLRSFRPCPSAPNSGLWGP
jgi:hypothetical protein